MGIHLTPENFIKNEICWYLHMRGDVELWVNSSVGIYDSVKKIYRKSYSRFHRKGVSDILGVFKCGAHKGKLLAVEVKSTKGRLSPEQKEFIDLINSCGGIALFAKSADECKSKMPLVDKTI